MTYPKIIHWNYFETSKCLNIVYVEDKATEKEIKRLGFIPYMFKQEVPGITIEEVQIKSVKDLKNGFVKLSEYFGGRKYTSYWDGEHIKVVFADDKNYKYLLIKPTDETLVTFVDENTLKSN